MSAVKEDSTSTIYNLALDPTDVLKDLYGQTEYVDVPSEPEDNEITYIVTIEPGNAEVFLIVSDVSIKEKDVLTAR